MSKKQPPSGAEVKQARAAAELTQAEAASLIYSETRSWQRYESGERTMHPAFFELFKIKTRIK